MTTQDTAPLCRATTRTWARARIHLVASTAIAAITLTALTLAPAAGARERACRDANTAVAAASRHELQQAVACLVNRQRTERGLLPLHVSPRLNRSAQGWTNIMVSHPEFSHGADFAGRISAVGFRWSSIGENIATGFQTPAGLVRGWMASTGHCQNILSPAFADVGTGVSRRPVTDLRGATGTWTEDFGLPMGAHAPSGNSAPASGCPY